jgi:hypothetical protein
MNYDATLNSAFARLQQAQMAQLASLAQQRYTQPVVVPSMPVDSVTLGGGLPELGLMPNPRQMAQAFQLDSMAAPLSSDPNYWEKQDAYYDKLLQQLAILKALEAANGTKSDAEGSQAKKGDLNVVAGNRNDGVKAKKVTIHEHRNWSTRQWDENVGGYRDHESKFENAQVGKTYQVNVEWEDGSTTTRNVQMDSPGQTVYIDTAY